MSFRRRLISTASAAFLVGVLAFGTTSATAGVASGNNASLTASGVVHQHRAKIITTSEYARSNVIVEAPVSRPAGYMGARVRQYKNGSLLITTIWFYNSSATTLFQGASTNYTYQTGVFYSGGQGQAWSTSGSYYVTGTTPISPSQNVPG